MQNDWFSQVSADIFISHSHNDKDVANTFAGWLYMICYSVSTISERI